MTDNGTFDDEVAADPQNRRGPQGPLEQLEAALEVALEVIDRAPILTPGQELKVTGAGEEWVGKLVHTTIDGTGAKGIVIKVSSAPGAGNEVWVGHELAFGSGWVWAPTGEACDRYGAGAELWVCGSCGWHALEHLSTGERVNRELERRASWAQMVSSAR